MAIPGLYTYIPLDGTQSEKIKADEEYLQTLTDFNEVKRSLTTRKGHLTRAKNLVIRDKEYNDKFRLKGKATYERYLETKITLEDRWDMLLNGYRRLLQLLPLQTDEILAQYEETYAVFWDSRDVIDALIEISDPFPQDRPNGQDQIIQQEPREAQPEKVADWAKALKPTTLTETSHASMFQDFEERLFIFFKANKIFKASPQEQREVARQYLSKNLFDIIRNQITPELPVFLTREDEGYVPGEINSMMELLQKEFRSLQPTTNRRLAVFRKKQRAGQSSAAFCSEVVREAQAANMQALTEEDLCSLIIINGLTSNSEVEEVLKNFRAEDELDLQVIIESVKTLEKNKRTTGCVSKESEIFQMSNYKKHEMQKRKNYALENYFCSGCQTRGHTNDRCPQRSNSSSSRGRGQVQSRGQNQNRGRGRGQNHGNSSRGGSSARGQTNRGRGRGHSFSSNRGQNRGNNAQTQNNQPQNPSQNPSQLNTLVEKPHDFASLINFQTREFNTEGKYPSYLNVFTGDEIQPQQLEHPSSSGQVQNRFTMDPMDFNPNVPLFMQMSGPVGPATMRPASEFPPSTSISQEHNHVLDLSLKSASQPVLAPAQEEPIIESEVDVEAIEVPVDPNFMLANQFEDRPKGRPRSKWSKYYNKDRSYRVINKNRKANPEDCIRYFSDQPGMSNVQCRIFAKRGSKAWKRAVVSARYEMLSKGYNKMHKKRFRKIRINDRVLVRSNYGYYNQLGTVIGFLEHDQVYLANSRKQKDRCRSVEIMLDEGGEPVKRAIEHCIPIHALDKHAKKQNLVFTVNNQPFDFTEIEDFVNDPSFIFSLVDTYNESFRTLRGTEIETFTDSYDDMSSCDERPEELIQYLIGKKPNTKKKFSYCPSNNQESVASRISTVNILRKQSSQSTCENSLEKANLAMSEPTNVKFRNDFKKAIEKRPFLEGSCENFLHTESSSDNDIYDDISSLSKFFQKSSNSTEISANDAEGSSAARYFDGAQDGKQESESRAELPSSQPVQASAAAAAATAAASTSSSNQNRPSLKLKLHLPGSSKADSKRFYKSKFL